MKKCTKCGLTRTLSEYNLIDKKTLKYNTMCKRCVNEKYLERTNTLHGYLKKLASNSKDRNITYEELLKVYYKQKGLCAVSKIKMTHTRGQGKVNTNISIDRIKKGCNGGQYTIDNIRLVTNQVNISINKWSDKDFIDMCKNVIKNNKDTKH